MFSLTLIENSAKRENIFNDESERRSQLNVDGNCRIITKFTQQNRSLIGRVKSFRRNFISSMKILHFQMTYDLMKIVFSSLLSNFQSSLICNRQTRTAHSFNSAFPPPHSLARSLAHSIRTSISISYTFYCIILPIYLCHINNFIDVFYRGVKCTARNDKQER